ncbi:MAG: alcohol dehydrogenase catalytic domain-containing protein [Actinomycetota bacterium]|nr:alcohol dehydrogenase catalytic domain-containing protein [Actinomycetota bacterium]
MANHGQVLVRVGAVGICGSDLEMIAGTRDPGYRSYPVVLGHEWAGEIVELGGGVGQLELGQYVAVEGHNYCGRCRQCKRGETQLCETYSEFGFTLDGGYAEFVAARGDLCHSFSRVSSVEAALAEPTACSLHGVLRSGVEPGDTVVVVGAGTIGLLAVGLFSLYSPENLIVIDRHGLQRSPALAMGATHYLIEGKDDVLETVQNVSGGRGADVSFEAGGHPSAVQTAVAATARRGKVVLEGISGTDSLEPIDLDQIVLGDLRIEGVFAYPSRVFAQALKMIDSGLLDVKPLITHRLPLAEADHAFELLKDTREPTIKVLLEPDAGSE